VLRDTQHSTNRYSVSKRVTTQQNSRTAVSCVRVQTTKRVVQTNNIVVSCQLIALIACTREQHFLRQRISIIKTAAFISQ